MTDLLVFYYALFIFVTLNTVQGSRLVSYGVTPSSTQDVYQLYDIQALTKPEADDICARCTTGKTAIVKDVTSHEFIRDILAGQAGIRNASYWLGMREKNGWRWDDSFILSWAHWASGNPLSGHTYAEARISGATTEWYSRTRSYRQGAGSFLVCRYDGGSTVGVRNASWSAWSRCDLDRRQQVRRKLCTSPAANVTVGCTCEDRMTETQECLATPQELNQSASGVIYQQYYGTADRYQAQALCGRCETGAIIMPKTPDDADDIRDTVTIQISFHISRTYYPIGLLYNTTSGNWTWQDGSALDWAPWYYTFPHSDPDKNVASMFWHSNRGVQWRNTWMTSVTYNVICQYDPWQSGLYGEWESWDGCVSDFTATWTGVRTRRKRCKAPGLPGSGGCSCEDEVTESEACTPAAVDLYFTGNDAYLLFYAGTDMAGANQICATWCPTNPVGVVQYQNQSKYQDIYQNLVSNRGFQRHHVGLSVITEGYWMWQDGSRYEAFPVWQRPRHYSDYLLNHALLTAQMWPYLTLVMYNSTYKQDMSDSIVCEFPGVTGPNGTYSAWSSWSDCDATNGTQTRNRTCLVPAPTLTGCHCAEEDWQTQNCIPNTTSTSPQATTTSSTTFTTTTTLATPGLTPTPTSTLTASVATTQPPGTTTQPPVPPGTTTQPPAATTYPHVATTQPHICICRNCQSPIADEIVKEKIRELVANLTIEKTTLSSFRRRLTSAEDVRPSARNIGICVGSLVVGVIGALLVVMDFGFAVAIVNWLKGIAG